MLASVKFIHPSIHPDLVSINIFLHCLKPVLFEVGQTKFYADRASLSGGKYSKFGDLVLV